MSRQHVLDALTDRTGDEPAIGTPGRFRAGSRRKASQSIPSTPLAAAVHGYGFEARPQVALVTSPLEERPGSAVRIAWAMALTCSDVRTAHHPARGDTFRCGVRRGSVDHVIAAGASASR